MTFAAKRSVDHSVLVAFGDSTNAHALLMFAASLTQGFVAALHRDGIEEQRALVQIVDVLKLSPPKDYPLPAALYNYHRLILSDGEFILEAIVCPRQGEEKALVKYHLALLKEFSLLRRHSPASLYVAPLARPCLFCIPFIACDIFSHLGSFLLPAFLQFSAFPFPSIWYYFPFELRFYPAFLEPLL